MSAYWQLNDPDWVPWFVYYVFAAVAALLVPRHERGWQMAAALCVIDRQTGGREALQEHGLELHALLTMQDIEQA